MTRNGILAAGNFIMYHTRMIDGWPAQDMTATILSETCSNGGGAYDLLKDLSAMRAPFPLAAAGLVGYDVDGEWILADCNLAGIDTTALEQTEGASTSHTEAMVVASTRRMTSFHQPGASEFFGVKNLDLECRSERFLHIGSLMALERLDGALPDGRTEAAALLEQACYAGMITSVDFANCHHPSLRRISKSILPLTDYLIINEEEASHAAGIEVYDDQGINVAAIIRAGQTLIQGGVRRQVVIHFLEGAVTVTASGEIYVQGSVRLPRPGFIVGTHGVGAAFTAGYLYAIHEGLPPPEALRLAVTTAAASLTHQTPSGGLRPVQECHALVATHPFRELRYDR